MAVVATIGSESANSYVSNAEADSWFATTLAATQWAALTSGQKDAILVRATRDLECLNYWGQRCTLNQALKFPRMFSCKWVSTAIPPEIKTAQLEQAAWILRNLSQSADGSGIDQRQQLQDAGVIQFQVGDMSETFKSNRTYDGLSAEARRVLYGARAVSRTGIVHDSDRSYRLAIESRDHD